MGTRGAFGVVTGGEEKISYNHFDSYPEGHGIENLQWLRSSIELGLEGDLRQLAENCKVVNEDNKPTSEDIANLAGTTNLNVSDQSTDDWYCLTRDTQGSIPKMIECGYILDAADFVLDTLFCEWAYVVDFDKRTFEVYSDRREGSCTGRWDHVGGVSLIASYGFDALPTDEDFLDDTAGPMCTDCGYRGMEGEDDGDSFTCIYCIDKKAAV